MQKASFYLLIVFLVITALHIFVQMNVGALKVICHIGVDLGGNSLESGN